MNCEGICASDGSCRGEVLKTLVRRVDGKEEWKFNYCEDAALSDLGSGFYIESEHAPVKIINNYNTLVTLVKELGDKNNKGFIAELCREKLREIGEL